MGRKVKVAVVDQEQHDKGLFDFGGHEEGSLDRVIASLVAIRDGIPERYRAKASCRIDSVRDYEDSHHAQIEVYYYRPETPEEATAREAAELARRRSEEAHARATYEALKQRFEGR